MAKYQIITWNEDNGADELREYTRKAEAIRIAKNRCYFTASGCGTDRGVIVYDLQAKSIVSVFGYFPEYARPIEE